MAYRVCTPPAVSLNRLATPSYSTTRSTAPPVADGVWPTLQAYSLVSGHTAVGGAEVQHVSPNARPRVSPPWAVMYTLSVNDAFRSAPPSCRARASSRPGWVVGGTLGLLGTNAVTTSTRPRTIGNSEGVVSVA